jgi:hypothetical protein
MDEDNDYVNSIWIKGIEGLFNFIWHLGYDIPKKNKEKSLIPECFPEYDEQYMNILWELEKLL